jgi:hypothetical protein
VGKGIATLCLIAGGIVAAVGFDVLPPDFVPLRAPKDALAGGGVVLSGMGLLALGRDHRLSETLTSLLILGVAGVSGWLTFYAPPGTLHRYVPFVPPTVSDSLTKLLFGLGTVACIGMAFWGFRRILR